MRRANFLKNAGFVHESAGRLRLCWRWLDGLPHNARLISVLTKAARLRLFFAQLTAAPAAASHDEALALFAAVLIRFRRDGDARLFVGQPFPRLRFLAAPVSFVRLDDAL